MDKEKTTEKLLHLFRNTAEPLQLKNISREMGFKSNTEEYQQLKIILNDLVQKNVLEKSTRRRYMLKDLSPSEKIKGVIRIENEKGIVYTNISELPKIIVKRNNLATALDGDEVLVNLFALRQNKKPRGEVVQILNRSKESIIGRIEHEDGFYFLVPIEEKHYLDFLIHPQKTKGAKEGDKAAAKLINWDDPNKLPVAEVVDIIGRSGKPAVEFESVIREFNLPEGFEKNIESEAENIPAKIPDQEIKRRLDFRKEEIITIDPFDAKDFDDALSLKFLDNGNYYLGVHIADVSYYVRGESLLDEEALARGNSIYLVDRVIPMLPEKLSNNVCSLRPNEDRLAYSVFMEISPRGALKDYQIVETVINSKRRFTYEEVQEIIDTKEGDKKDLILALHGLAAMLRKKRMRQGLDIETLEVKFILDENKYPVDAVLKSGTPANNLVEECMLMANKTVAQHAGSLTKKFRLRKKIPFLYRVHDLPNKDKIKNVIDISNMLGYKITKKKLEKKDINNLLHKVKDKPEKYIINQMLLRSMAKAEYSSENIGHYGLGFKDYTHFTSPIRRYPDLIVHRLLKEYTAANKISKEKLMTMDAVLEEIGEHCTGMERLAQECERASNKLTQAVMADRHIGDEFNATISGITGFGMFIIMDDIHAEGLVHMRDLNDDYYIYDEKNFRLIGKRYKRIFRIGKRVRVRIIKVNIEKRRIDLEFLEDIKE